MNKLNKKLHKIDTNKNRNKTFGRVHNVYKDLKYWEWLYLEDENNKLTLTAVLDSDNVRFYEYDACKTMNIPFKQGGKSYGKK